MLVYSASTQAAPRFPAGRLPFIVTRPRAVEVLELVRARAVVGLRVSASRLPPRAIELASLGMP